MKRISVWVGVLALALLSCGGGEKQSSIEGNLVGADGKVPALAHVHLIALGGDVRTPIESAEVGEDGSFRMALPDNGYYALLVTAVNHRDFRIPLVSDDGFTLTGVRITPQPYQYKDPLEEVRIIGDWEHFAWGGAEPMTLADDGTFTYERETEADTMAYQLLGAEEGGRSINGTDSDYYIYDGGGDYISVVMVEGGTARVVFDPGQARISSTQDLPAVDFGDPNLALAEIWAIQKRWDSEMERSNRAYEEYMEEKGTPEGFEYDMSAIKQYLMSEMSAGRHPIARRFAAVTMAGILDLGRPLENDELLAMTKVSPVTDPMWVADPTAFPEVFEQAYGRGGMVKIFEDNLDQVVDKKVRAAMLLELGLEAKGAGDTVRQREIYNDLIKNQPDVNVPYISYRIETQLDPDLAVTDGKPVPEFEVALLGGKGTVSNKSMLGKYYLIDFWATWCGPCVREMPHLDSAYEKFKGKGFQILSISLDQKPEDIEGFRTTKWAMPWLHAFAEGMFESDIATRFEVTGIPKPVLVGPDGIIIASGPELRGTGLEKTLEEHLGI
jgi:thiol-disulfide isomerase/thioredoxin